MHRCLATYLSLLLCCALLMGGGPARSEVGQLTEHQVKAAYLFNFAKFVEWPPAAFGSTSAPLVIGILGKGLAAEAREALAGRLIKGRRVQVRYVERIEEIPGCHILYISSSERPRLKEIMKGVPTGVLTVSDIRHFCTLGGMIGLVSRGEKWQFEINLGNAERAGLKLSAQMLKLALSVIE